MGFKKKHTHFVLGLRKILRFFMPTDSFFQTKFCLSSKERFIFLLTKASFFVVSMYSVKLIASKNVRFNVNLQAAT